MLLERTDAASGSFNWPIYPEILMVNRKWKNLPNCRSMSFHTFSKAIPVNNQTA